MDKITYLAELAEGLARWVPERERQDILRYYAEYFEEAGPAREAEVIQELGDPWALSSRLAVEGGYVTQEQAVNWTPPPRKKLRWPWVLAGVAAVVVIAGISIAAQAVRFGLNTARNVAVWASDPVRTAYVEAVDEVDTVYNEPVYESSDYGEVSYVTNAGGLWSMEDGSLDSFQAIDADISLGSVTVTGGEDFTLFIDQSGSFGGYRVKWEVKNGVLKLRDGGAGEQALSGNWSDLKQMVSGLRCGVDVVVTVPEGWQLDKVALKTNLGNLNVSDLDVAVKVEAETDMGDVECYSVRAPGKIDLETDMGNVTLGLDELFTGMEIDLETSMGNVESNLDCEEAECAYEAKTGMGEVIVNGTERGTKAQRKGSALYHLEAESGMGDVNLFFQEDRW